jgi:transcriptional regulator with XRE-family HTH domain
MFDKESWAASGMSIADLADAAGVSFTTAWRWVGGLRPSPLGRRRLVEMGLWIHVPVKGAA